MITANFQIYKRKNDQSVVRHQMHEGKQHIILPVTMMVEGVHHGSQGAIYHSIDELGKIPASWNGIPIVINHPQRDGNFVSANSPDIIDSSVTVGRVYNTNVQGNRLRAEAWLVEEKLIEHASDVFDAINNNTPVEVSVGVFTENQPVENGNWNSETYTHAAHNHRPDHLALLPGGVGACSINDGCGLGANKVTQVPVEEVNVNIMSNVKNENAMPKTDCGKCMEKIVEIIQGNVLGFSANERTWLLEQDEAILDKILSGKPAPAPQANAKVEITPEQAISALSAQDKADYESGKTARVAKRAELIKGIQDNTSKELWPDAELNAMSDATLEKIFKSAKKVEVEEVDYSLNSGFRPKVELTDNAGNGPEPLYFPGIEIETK